MSLAGLALSRANLYSSIFAQIATIKVKDIPFQAIIFKVGLEIIHMKDISSTASFVDFTLENFIYVDKTEYIPKLVKLKRVFISRPRHFGKSLTLDTIGTLFEKGVEPYFKDT